MLETATRETDGRCPGLLYATGEQLVLRATRPGHDGQVIRLATPKSTIGAAAACTVRVPCDGVQPIHCTILRGPRGVVVHRWADATLLNGKPFTDAPLRVGDRLAIGPVEFELLSDGTPDSDAAGSQTATQRLERFEQSQGIERRRTRRILAELRAARWELSRWQADAAHRGALVQSLEEKSAALESAVVDLTAHVANDQFEFAHFAADRASLATRLAAGESEQQRLHRELDESRQSFARERDGWLAERAELSSEVEISRRQIEHEQHRHDATQLQYSLRLQQFESTQHQLQTRLQEVTADAQEIDTLRQRIADAENAVSLAREQQVAAEARADHAAIERAEQQCQHKAFAQQLDAVTTQLRATLEQLRQAESERDRLHTQVSDAARDADLMRQQLAESQSRVARFGEQLSAGQQQIESLLRQHADTVRQLTDTQNKRDAACRELDQERADWEQERPVIEQMRRDLEHLLAAAAVPQPPAGDPAELESLRHRIVDLEIQCDDTTRRLEATGAERHRLQTQVDKAALDDLKSAELEHLARQAADEAARVRQQADELRRRVAELEREQAEWDQQRRRLESAPRLPCTDVNVDASVESVSDSATPASTEQTLVATEALAPIESASTSLEANVREPSQTIADCESPRQVSLESPTAAALARLGRAGIWHGNNSVQESSADPPAVAPPPTRTSPGNSCESPAEPVAETHGVPPSQSSRDVIPPRGRAGGDDESIEDYMSRLLKRVRGEHAAKSYRESGAKADSDATDPRVGPVDSPPAQETAAPPAAVAPAAEPYEYAPRAVPPEFKTNLAAMREIANTSARTAIETHHKLGQRQSSKVKLIAALTTATAATAILAFSYDKPWPCLGAASGFVLTLFWLVQSLRLARIARPTPQPNGSVDAALLPLVSTADSAEHPHVAE